MDRREAIARRRYLNHEVVDKIRTWQQAFGHNGVVGAALPAGVYKTSKLVDAQDEGVSIFWSHELCKLGDFSASDGKMDSIGGEGLGRGGFAN